MFQRYRSDRGSWHIPRTPGVAWCSRVIDGAVATTLPETEKSCETCFRRKAKVVGA